MDEVSNPNLPLAGEKSPTLRPIDDESDVGLEDNNETKPPLDTAEAQGLVDSANPSPTVQPALPASRPTRPGVTRETSAPSPQQPPPAPPTQSPAETSDFPSDPPDSLTLADLKRIRSTFPAAPEAPLKQQVLDYDTVYDFAYQDAQSLPVEIEEWFSYSEYEELALRKCKAMFNQEWRASGPGGEGRCWLDVTEDARREFVEKEVRMLEGKEGNKGTTSLMILVYVALGVWEETAGRQEGCALEDLFPGGDKGGAGLERYQLSSLQIQWIVGMVDTLHECGGLKVIYEVLKRVCEESFAASPIDTASRNEQPPKRGEESMELWCCLTLMYLFVEVARTTEGTNGKALKQDILSLEPKLLHYFTQIVARLRWDDYAPLPLTKLLLLAWKTILVTFGGIADVEHLKTSLRSTPNELDIRGQPIITASPLDYHLFRQEISSKYPAYQPPPPLFPLEPENNSILPPLKHRRPSYAANDTAAAFPGAPSVTVTQSILHQPVHIATPAPSPPPSPAGPGKAGKKQNYQTNQMFPFLYPPLDASSSELGGKGSTQLQDVLVGRKWEGADIPASILEAAELFAKRMRATRGMRQLWEARVGFMRFERGWRVTDDDDNAPLDGAEEDDDDADVDDGFELLSKPPAEETATQGRPLPTQTQTEEQKQLDAVNAFYRASLPYLQSVVIVLLKAMLQNVTDLISKSPGPNGGAGGVGGGGGGLQPGIHFAEPNANNLAASGPPADNAGGINGGGGASADGSASTTPAEDLDRLRQGEITAKALSAILLLLLKWFKVSHILQYEYLTQLLLDSNYVPLVLKLWQTQDIGRACHYRLDRDESDFFYFCRANSRQGPPVPANIGKETLFDEEESEEEEEEGEGEGDAAPPPIKRERSGSRPSSSSSDDESEGDPLATYNPGAALNQLTDFPHPPEIDELGYPTTPLPSAPLKTYNWRAMFTAINHLRALQKVTRRKTHRALLLVSYKSSTHLKKTLKIPVQQLRYYTLKLFKSQVPFCGRKWRQGNMKIITAVYLSVPAELRDDWLSGGGGGMGGAGVGDVDGAVEDAVPLEQALRALTRWWNVVGFGEAIGVDKGLLMEEEVEFFGRELGRMGEGLGQGVGQGGEEGVGDERGEGWCGPIEGY